MGSALTRSRASPAGLTTQVGFIRLAHQRTPNSGEPEFGGPSPSQKRFAKTMELQVKPGNDRGDERRNRTRVTKVCALSRGRRHWRSDPAMASLR
jgi:hypothetical protein